MGSDSGDALAPAGEFDPGRVPEPGRVLDGHDVLAGDDHVDVHQTARALFEERGVYDVTFGYNLADLNRDTRHENAGYRYAVEHGEPPDAAELPADDAVLRAEFTPTTPFCPQSHTLALGSFRAWNALRDRHDFGLVRIRVAGMHHRSDAINDAVRSLETEFVATGAIPDPGDRESDAGGRSPVGDAPF